MRKKVWMAATASLLGLFLTASVAMAQHQHGGASVGGMKMETKDVVVEGVKVSFMVMANEDHRKMLKDMKMKEDIEPGSTHNVTVTLKDEKTQREITDAQATMKVIDPAGKDQVKPLKFEESMKSYDAYFNLPGTGKYQVILLFKTSDQRKRTAGIYHELK